MKKSYNPSDEVYSFIEPDLLLNRIKNFITSVLDEFTLYVREVPTVRETL